MIVRSEDAVEVVFLLVSEQSHSRADRLSYPVQIVTRVASTPIDLGLESSPRFIELGANESNDMEWIHDRCCFW